MQKKTLIAFSFNCINVYRIYYRLLSLSMRTFTIRLLKNVKLIVRKIESSHNFCLYLPLSVTLYSSYVSYVPFLNHLQYKSIFSKKNSLKLFKYISSPSLEYIEDPILQSFNSTSIFAVLFLHKNYIFQQKWHNSH